jgi:hypothetical protein
MVLSFSLTSSKISLSFSSATKKPHAFPFAPNVPPARSTHPSPILAATLNFIRLSQRFLCLYLRWFVISDLNVFWVIKQQTTKAIDWYFMRVLY